MAEGTVQLATEGTGKKVATREIVRADGSTVELQQVVLSDPATGDPQPAPPWDDVKALLGAVLNELRVLTTLVAEQSGETDLTGLRKDLTEEGTEL